jgi:hypothetical protein
MAFVPPVIFVDGTQLQAVDLKSNFDTARSYLNVDIDEGDLALASFGTADLQEGEGVRVTPDFIFMSGDIYSHAFARHASIPQERHYHTSTVKRYEPLKTTRFVSVPNLAKQWYMEDDGNALIEISFFTFEGANNDCRGAVFPWTTNVGGKTRSNGQDTQYLLAIDGSPTVAATETIGYAFAESGTTTQVFGQDSIMDGQSNYQGNTTGMRKYISILYLAKNLTQGWHQVSVLCNACNEEGFVSMRNLNIETFYNMGYAPVSKNSIATNRKLKETIF